MSKAILTLLSLLLAGSLMSQTNTLSPYSIYGLGDSPYSSLSAQAGMSHTNLAFLSVLNVNVNNPANLSYLTKPTFNFDFRNELLSLSSGDNVQTNNLVSIENLSFAFPIINNPQRKRRAAFAFGIKPYSRQGYNIASYQDQEEFGVLEYRFIGEGGINRAFLGTGIDLLADSSRNNVLSVGVVGSYVFGSIYRNRITMVDSISTLNGSNLFREERNEISSADVRIGLLYTKKLTFQRGDEQDFGSFSIGGFYQPALSLNTSTQEFTYTFADDYTTPILIDTISFRTSGIPTSAPASFGVGLGMTYENKWNVGIDLTMTQWSVLEIDGSDENLNDELRISAGVEHIPDPTSYKQLSKIIRYRAGLSYEQTRLNVNGIQPNRFGISAGLGIPIRASRSTSMFNLGIEYARRGASGLPVVENYLNAHIGLTLTPNQFDRWFAKRKYD